MAVDLACMWAALMVVQRVGDWAVYSGDSKAAATVLKMAVCSVGYSDGWKDDC